MATKRHQIFVGDVEPVSCIVGDVWVDTSASPAAIKRCISIEPILFSDMTMGILGGSLKETGEIGRVAVNIGAATLIRPANPERLTLAIRNLHSSETVYQGFDSSVTADTGFPLPAGRAMIWEAGIEGYIGAIYCISASGIIPMAWSEV